MNGTVGAWKRFVVPLAGGENWTKTTSGEVGLADIDWVEIHNDTWGTGEPGMNVLCGFQKGPGLAVRDKEMIFVGAEDRAAGLVRDERQKRPDRCQRARYRLQ
jgi:hypothetical protein